MKFKIDENLPLEAAQTLRESGHDVFTVYAEQLIGIHDEHLAGVCKSEGRALITLDLHFADIRSYPPSEFHGLIVLRLARQDKSHVLGVLRGMTKLLDSEILNGKLWIVDEERVRVRS